MSRGLDEARSPIDRDPDRDVVSRSHARTTPHDNDWASRGLTLPRQPEREVVRHRDREYSLDSTDTRALATVGAFRVIVRDDLTASGSNGSIRPENLDRLEGLGLMRHESFADSQGSRQVVTLSREGKALLEANRDTRATGRQQEYYAGVVKPRELRHDAQVWRAFQAEAARIERDGGRVVRVMLDYELKRDYQRYLNRSDRPADAILDQDRLAFAEAHDLTVVRGHLELPDLRIEYESASGRLEHRDIELVTEHYSRGQMRGKTQAGFVMYRCGGGSAGAGGSPFDPRHLERLG